LFLSVLYKLSFGFHASKQPTSQLLFNTPKLNHIVALDALVVPDMGKDHLPVLQLAELHLPCERDLRALGSVNLGRQSVGLACLTQGDHEIDLDQQFPCPAGLGRIACQVQREFKLRRDR